MEERYPIIEFDPTRAAFFEPWHLTQPIDLPEHCVITFFHDVIEQLVKDGRARQIALQHSEMGDHPVYEIEVGNRRLAMFHPGIGGPMVAFLLEEVIALGCKKFIACGGAGVLMPNLPVGHIIVPDRALRDEGTSYHYLAPSRDVAASPEGVAAIEQTLAAHGYPYVKGKTWTTDAIYRETEPRIARRRAEGCIAVEMEAAALFAVAQFRAVSLAQLLYGGDDLSSEEWDGRDWTKHSARETLFWLAAEACLAL